MQLFPRTHVYLHLRTTCVDLQVQAKVYNYRHHIYYHHPYEVIFSALIRIIL